MGATDDDLTERVVAAASAMVLGAGVLTGLFIIATAGQAVVAFLMLSVVPALLGYAGLQRATSLPWQGDGPAGAVDEEDLHSELERRYDAGEIDADELRRTVGPLLADEPGRPATDGREPEGETEREPEPLHPSP